MFLFCVDTALGSSLGWPVLSVEARLVLAHNSPPAPVSPVPDCRHAPTHLAMEISFNSYFLLNLWLHLQNPLQIHGHNPLRLACIREAKPPSYLGYPSVLFQTFLHLQTRCDLHHATYRANPCGLSQLTYIKNRNRPGGGDAHL